MSIFCFSPSVIGSRAEKQHPFTVLKIKGDTVFLDGNHPWAGKELRFSLKVTDVRAATPEEVTHKHAHGAHGHHH